jgi:hypothetical protein
MATEQATTWICDRCGAREQLPADRCGWQDGWAHVVLKRGNELQSDTDVCGACWEAYVEWLDAPRKAKAADIRRAFLLGKSRGD